MLLVLANMLQDLVFQFPWNNFLHSVVYDILHQVLFGKVEGTLNRELIVALFRDVRLPQRILDAQTRNDA
jgi:serine/threonine-protein phosphatase 6 regulatory subunit 3